MTTVPIILTICFIVGYIAIIIEHNISIDKSATSLLTGVLMWTIIALTGDIHIVQHDFLHVVLPEIAGILLFIIGAMTIVEVIDLHNGFKAITDIIQTKNKKKFLWIVGIVSFFMGAVLDNLTTAIVMVTLLRKLIDDKEERMLLAGVVIIAANAGGAWSPIGNVTTTLLWNGGQISPLKVFIENFIPGLICLIIPLIMFTNKFKGELVFNIQEENIGISRSTSISIFVLGIVLLLAVPIYKTITHLPPFMGMMFSLGVFWFIIDMLHNAQYSEEKAKLSVFKAMSKIDMPTVVFFFGILSAVAALEYSHVLTLFAQWMDKYVGNHNVIIYIIGLLSAIVDNVPLVAAVQGMYDVSQFPADSHFWHFVAYCAGTGGSILIIGSAAGVAAMGIEKIDFIWYAKRIGFIAWVGYSAGALFTIIWSKLLGM
jgi:Na+/H+ antiporter NhaD/arsenite permease-like protein